MCWLDRLDQRGKMVSPQRKLTKKKRMDKMKAMLIRKKMTIRKKVIITNNLVLSAENLVLLYYRLYIFFFFFEMSSTFSKYLIAQDCLDWVKHATSYWDRRFQKEIGLK